MENFSFQNATKIIFGKDSENSVGKELRGYEKDTGNKLKVLLHFGGGSIKKSGLYDRVTSSLKKEGIEYAELGGVVPNPRLDLVQQAIKLMREKNLNFILAVGGGSVIDSAKAIAAGQTYTGDVWDFFESRESIKNAVPIGVILTIPAAGSETSDAAVITKVEQGNGSDKKRAIHGPALRPQFAILNPALTYTLDAAQTSYGIADMMAHVMERYFTNTKHVDLSDHLCEAVLRSIIKNAPLVMAEPNNYDYRAEIMWAGTNAHSDLIGLGRIPDWGTHMIEHELSAVYDIAHGAGLAIIFPAWIKYNLKHDVARFAQFANRVFDIEVDLHNLENTARLGIAALEKFWRSLGLPTRLADLKIGNEHFSLMSKKALAYGPIGNFVQLGEKDVLAIYELALK